MDSVFLRSRNLDVRLEFDLCMEEKIFLQKRRKLVASALKKALNLEQDLQDHEVWEATLGLDLVGVTGMSQIHSRLLVVP